DAAAAAAAAMRGLAQPLQHQGSRGPPVHRVRSASRSTAQAGQRAGPRSRGKPFAARLAPASLHSGTNRRTPASLGTMLRLSCARGPVRELRRCAFGLFPYLPLAPTPLPVPLERPLPPSTAPRRLLVRARRDQVETSRQAP